MPAKKVKHWLVISSEVKHFFLEGGKCPWRLRKPMDLTGKPSSKFMTAMKRAEERVCSPMLMTVSNRDSWDAGSMSYWPL